MTDERTPCEEYGHQYEDAGVLARPTARVCVDCGDEYDE